MAKQIDLQMYYKKSKLSSSQEHLPESNVFQIAANFDITLLSPWTVELGDLRDLWSIFNIS